MNAHLVEGAGYDGCDHTIRSQRGELRKAAKRSNYTAAPY
jgi:hypothetical protein